MNTLRIKSEEMLEEARQDLEETRGVLHQQIEDQYRRIKQMDEAIIDSSRQLVSLKHYKDKEYPVRQVRIEQMREHQEDILASQADEIRQINEQVAEEKDHYDYHMRLVKRELESKATEVH